MCFTILWLHICQEIVQLVDLNLTHRFNTTEQLIEAAATTTTTAKFNHDLLQRSCTVRSASYTHPKLWDPLANPNLAPGMPPWEQQ